MSDNNRNAEFLSVLLDGYTRANAIRTQATLGDRSKYIGMSDIAKGFGCLRSAVASRVQPGSKYPDPGEIEYYSESEVKKRFEGIRPLERGHEQESGLVSAFNALGYDFVQQLEIRVEHEGVPIHVHLDFTVFHDDYIEVIESKSNEIIPEVNYVEYEAQVFGQIGLMHRFFNEPVFSIRDEDGRYIVENQSLEAIATQRLGEGYLVNGRLPVNAVKGTLLSMSGKSAEAFGPYTPNSFMTDAILSKAVFIWKTARKVAAGSKPLDDVEHKYGFHPLCDFCEHNYNCPKFTDATRATSEVVGDVFTLKQLQEQSKELEKQIKAVKKHLGEVYDGLDLNGSDYIDAGKHRFRHAQCSRKALNEELLLKKLDDIGFDEDEAKAIVDDCKKESSFRKLETNKIRRPKKKAAA